MSTRESTSLSTPGSAPLMLSVSGARGIVGRSMTPAVAAEFGSAFGSFIKGAARRRDPLVCVGRDSRPSGLALSAAAVGGLAATGCRVVDLGVLATPSAAIMISKRQAAGGMVITASHNPIQWNGLKCLNADGVAPPPDDAAKIITRFRQKHFDYAAPDQPLSIERDDTANQEHVATLLRAIKPAPIRRAKFKVVLDSVNGGGGSAGRLLLERLGCRIVHLNGEPTGQFAHAPEPTETNLKDLARATRKHKAACGFAQDPDADRLAIIDETGTYIGEEYTLALAAKFLLDQRAAANNRTPVVLAANLSTSRMIDDLAANYQNVSVIRTAVGEANVVAGLKPAKRRALLGGEGNGGVIFPPVCWVRDSLSAMALTLSLLAASRQSLSECVAQLPRYKMIKHKFDAESLGGADAIAHSLERVAARFAKESVSRIDGVRIDLPDGWVHLRASNTEPIIRLIAEASNDSRAWELIDEVATAAGLR